MKGLLLLCSGLLLIGIADLPIGYYTLLRIVVTIGSVAIVMKEFQNGLNFWVVVFGFLAILFNPILPIYFNNKAVWLPFDIIGAIMFIIKSFTFKQE